MRLPRAAGLVLLLVIYALHVGRRKPADVLPVQDGVLLINATWSVTPAPVSRLEPLYGFATLILSADYVAHALTLCRNLKLGMRPSWPAAHLHVVAFIPADSQARNISTAILRCCFDNVISLPPVVVQRPSRWAKYNEQYIKLGFWAAAEYAGLLYMDVDVHVVEPAVLYHLLVKSNATFAACADFWRNKYGAWINGGMFLLRPDAATYRDLLASKDTQPRPRFFFDLSEQGYLSVFFAARNATTLLPAEYNVNMAAARAGKANVTAAVAVHFTGAKPWSSPQLRNKPPYSWWWKYANNASEACKLSLQR